MKINTKGNYNMEDRLIIGYDKAERKDRQALIVARENGRGLWIVNQFYDKEAEEIYNKLTEPRVLVKDICELEQALVGRRDCTIYITNKVDIKLDEISWKDTEKFNKIQSDLMDRNITLKIYNRRHN